MKLELNLLELNELYLATSRLVLKNQKHLDELGRNVSSINYFKTQLDSSKVLRDKIQTVLYAEAKVLDEARDWVLKYKAEQYDRERDILKNAIDEEIEPEYDSAGFTEDDRIVNGQYRVISNEEADEDYRSTLIQDSNRYESSVEKDYTNHLAKLKERGYVTQTLLNYVDKRGAVSYTELESYYKIITGGSNSFSHILDNLRTPYKNRKTQRYIAKEGKRYSDAKYVIKVANPSNWVVVDSGYKTFNEAPYGND